jgi:stress response protein YsnF
MTLAMLMQSSPVRANELFVKLFDTSDGAIKTREKLYSELKAELELHASLEEQHLFPLLRKNAETKDLVVDAVKENKEMRAKLAELETLPKNDEAFPQRLSELQKAFRQHARDEKKELLPAVKRALSAEQIEVVTEKMEAGLAEAEQAKQDELEERRAKARQEREQAELEAEAAEREQQAQAAAERRNRDAARRMANAALKPVEVVNDGTRQIAKKVMEAPRSEGDAARRAPVPVMPFTNLFLWPWSGLLQGSEQGRPLSISTAKTSAGLQEVIPLGEEVLEVTKRTENRGTARIRRYVVETSVEQQVTLASERVIVERRRPAQDKVTGEVLTNLTVEMDETAEVPVIGKRLRLREEIVIRTERTEHVETVQETIRRDEVEIQQPGKKHPARERPNS